MLTDEAIRHRKWGLYPALRKALENKKISDSYYGLTSASDNIFDRMVRLAEIATLLREFRQDVIDTAQSTGEEQMYKDLQELEHGLLYYSDFFRKAAGEVESFYPVLMKRQ